LKILFVFGTRPEAIKMAPLIKEFEAYRESFQTGVCVTAQHREMLDQVLGFFDISPDYDLDLMRPDQSLFDVTADGLKGLERVFGEYGPDLVFVQGDTTTAFVGALAGYYNKIKVAHLEAGLRSGDRYSPFPEEMNRVMAGHLSDYHFAPTERAARNLAGEGITENVWVVGNSVIDALFLGLQIVRDHEDGDFYEFFRHVDFSRRIILVTGHRRESFGEPFKDICNALGNITDAFADVEVVYPVHLNPNVRRPVNEILNDRKRVHLIEPLDYPRLIWLMEKSYIVLTDSGGIQEEAPSLGKPVLVMREVTERMEGIEAGTAKLVGTSREKILHETEGLLTDGKLYDKMSSAANPYGDGRTSKRIIEILLLEK
jgi:UDP-N-acetylglucosamine 2-epimerase (non-hydrolysing)